MTFISGGERKLLFDFGQMPVLRHAVRADAFVAFAKKIINLGLAARAADTTQGISDDAGGLDESGFEQRNGRQQNARRITAGRRDEQRFL